MNYSLNFKKTYIYPSYQRILSSHQCKDHLKAKKLKCLHLELLFMSRTYSFLSLYLTISPSPFLELSSSHEFSPLIPLFHPCIPFLFSFVLSLNSLLELFEEMITCRYKPSQKVVGNRVILAQDLKP